MAQDQGQVNRGKVITNKKKPTLPKGLQPKKNLYNPLKPATPKKAAPKPGTGKTLGPAYAPKKAAPKPAAKPGYGKSFGPKYTAPTSHSNRNSGGGGGGPYVDGPGPYRGPVSGGGGGGGGGGAVGVSAPAAPTGEYMDASALAQIAALKKALADYEADATGQTTRYNTDFNDALKNLGWQTGTVAAGSNPFGIEGGAWNETDNNTASGRAFTSQLNDFASRGTLQSSLFGTARDDLQRSLNDQLNSVVGSRTNFLSDLAKQRTAYGEENKLAQQQAKAEALARRAASYGI